MTEYLLVFVTVIAVWKVVQVWRLKRKLKAAQALASASIRRAMDDTNILKDRVDSLLKEPEPKLAPDEWPEEIG
jgi:hypothetical protein